MKVASFPHPSAFLCSHKWWAKNKNKKLITCKASWGLLLSGCLTLPGIVPGSTTSKMPCISLASSFPEIKMLVFWNSCLIRSLPGNHPLTYSCARWVKHHVNSLPSSLNCSGSLSRPRIGTILIEESWKAGFLFSVFSIHFKIIMSLPIPVFPCWEQEGMKIQIIPRLLQRHVSFWQLSVGSENQTVSCP